MLYSVSCTTRLPRQGEKDKRDYFFISQKSFKQKIKDNEFAEWAKVLANYYGTPRYFLEKWLKRGKNILLEIDVKGAKQIKKEYKKQSVLIFISPPSLQELGQRLKNRKTEGDEEICQRLKLAEKEMQEIKRYDYLVFNKSLRLCVEDIKTIIKAEGCRI